ncbi:Abi family protein [Lysinibacillus xylanilyticus]|uniref:Abi family protein n=1 Tax=Lysinibacillus xylanilyticus TaxID=582475 RepID=UPI00382D1494
MSIKPYKTVTEQKNILLSRGLTILDETFFEDYISRNNYFNVINGNEDLLLVSQGTGNKFYDTANFDDFVRLHKFDKKLSSNLTAILHNFETKLKSSISRNFCKRYCRTPQHTMQYTNKANYVDINTVFGTRYTLYYDQYGKIVDDFNDFVFFKSSFLYSLIKYNDFIDENIFSIDSTSYTPPTGCNSYTIYSGRKHAVVPIWVAIETLDFGALQRCCHYLTSDVINDVMSDFNLSPTDRELFLNSLDVIRELRNKCAHFSLINRFCTSLNVKILPSLINKLGLNPMEPSRRVYVHALNRRVLKNSAKLNLFDTLKVLGMYEDLSSLNKPLKNLIYQNNKHFKKNTYDLNERMLGRMGNTDYKEWKKLFS